LVHPAVRATSEFRQSIASARGPFPIAFLVIALAIVPTPATAQIFGKGILSAEVVGGTGALAIDEGKAKFASPLVAPQRNVDATGQLCLNVHPGSEPQTINTMIYNHILLLDNHCTKDIRIRACYYKTDSCQEITVHGNNRQRYVFGVFTEQNFRFSFREYVN
jgi:hypothetical protein